MNTPKKVKSSAPEILPNSGDVQSNAISTKPQPITVTITGNYSSGIRFYAHLSGLTVEEYIHQARYSRLECDIQDPDPEEVKAFLDLEKVEVVA